jgi:hypothetical protein
MKARKRISEEVVVGRCLPPLGRRKASRRVQANVVPAPVEIPADPATPKRIDEGALTPPEGVRRPVVKPSVDRPIVTPSADAEELKKTRKKTE